LLDKSIVEFPGDGTGHEGSSVLGWLPERILYPQFDPVKHAAVFKAISLRISS
jgi:hypothetical protein